MKSSPLLLERHVFKRVEITAAEDPDKDAVNLMSVTLTCARNQEERNRFRIGLRLKLAPHAEKTPAYTGEVDVEGYFRVSPEISAERQQMLAVTNGSGILFGAIREMLIGITARGPWPPLMLTTVS